MRKLFVLAAVVLAFIGVASINNVNAVVIGPGPVGRNQVRVYPGPDRGQLTVEWQRFFLDGENFSIHYGTGSGFYQYLSDHVGYISTYTITNLTPGQRYYVAVEGIRAGNVSAGWDGQVSAIAPASSVTVLGTTGPVGRNSLIGKTGTKKGTVDLSWKRFFNDTQLYNVVYGVKPGQYIYGALNAVDTTPADKGTYTYTIGALQSGKRYYFAIVPQRSDVAQYITPEVSVVAR